MRRRLAAVLSPLSKSTKTFEDHNRCWSSSRVTTSPGRSTSACKTCSGFPCNLSLTPCFRSSPVRTSNSKTPNRRILRALPLADSVDINHPRVPHEECATSYHCYGKVLEPRSCDFCAKGTRSEILDRR